MQDGLPGSRRPEVRGKRSLHPQLGKHLTGGVDGSGHVPARRRSSGTITTPNRPPCVQRLLHSSNPSSSSTTANGTAGRLQIKTPQTAARFWRNPIGAAPIQLRPRCAISAEATGPEGWAGSSDGGSSNGRTANSDSASLGSNPSPPANLFNSLEYIRRAIEASGSNAGLTNQDLAILGFHFRDRLGAIREPTRHRSGSPRRSHSRTGRSPGTRPPWRNPRPSRAAVKRQLGSIAIALAAARNNGRHDPPGRDHAGAIQLTVIPKGSAVISSA